MSVTTRYNPNNKREVLERELERKKHVEDNQEYYDAVNKLNKKVTEVTLYWDKERLLKNSSQELRTRFIRAEQRFFKDRYHLKKGIQLHEMMFRAYDALIRDVKLRGLNKIKEDFIFVKYDGKEHVICKNDNQRELAHNLYPDMIIFSIKELIQGYDKNMLDIKETFKEFNPIIKSYESKSKK